ncbi:MAG: outer membrane lipid asymmetry maintenance protein MlaD [Hyphomicrobiales bacterium]
MANSLETVVGAAVVALAAGFFGFAYKTAGVGTGAGSGGYLLIAEFDNAECINVGTEVRVAGITVGSVTAQSLDKDSYQARIEMTLDKSLILADDSAVKVTSEGLLGGKFIAIDPGGSDTKFADGGTFSYTQGAVDLWALIGQAMAGTAKGGAAPASDAAGADAPAAPAADQPQQ